VSPNYSGWEKIIDTVTHALAGAVIARCGTNKNIGKWAVAAGISAALFPDADFFARFISQDFYLRYHRGITTSVFLMFPVCLLLSYIFNRLSDKKHFLSFFKITVGAFLSHIFLDAVTSFGTMVLAPFSNYRVALDLLFIIDLYLTGILAGTLIFSAVLKKKAVTICRLGLGVSLLYIGFCAVNHQRANNLARQFAESRNLKYTKLASLPQPLSPLRWANLIQTEDKIYQWLIQLDKEDSTTPKLQNSSLLDDLGSKYNSPDSFKYKTWDRLPTSPWVDKALDTRGAKFFYWFARFPVVKGIYEKNGYHRVEFFDLRFYLFETRYPFLYIVEFDQQGKLIKEGFAV
jgi:inner membrane protein